jgi:hypothetical protein
MNGLKLFVGALETEGVTQIVSVPVEENLEALLRHKQARFQVVDIGREYDEHPARLSAPRRSTLASRLCDLAPNAAVPFSKADH